ncbi:MAG: hypothetical protein QOD92_1366 [Acidimicrobiaceae bacterium]|jgi:uncharacterized RDD family membrane protein YckC
MTDPIVWPSQPPLGSPIETSTSSTDLLPPPPEERRRPVASPLTRAGELGLEIVLVACTFGFGWIGWWIISWGDGQSPAKVVLRLHVVNAGDGQLASFGRMAVREALGKAAPGVALLAGVALAQPWLQATAAAYFAVSAAVMFVDVRRRTLWDRLAGTVVLEGDPPLVPARPTPPPMAPVEASTALG